MENLDLSGLLFNKVIPTKFVYLDGGKTRVYPTSSSGILHFGFLHCNWIEHSKFRLGFVRICHLGMSLNDMDATFRMIDELWLFKEAVKMWRWKFFPCLMLLHELPKFVHMTCIYVRSNGFHQWQRSFQHIWKDCTW